ncbi:MAG: HU family DNA-binding protein [Lachnospiraceae bacterium]|nr:HU family DNA-binding protein [Lachnospiraceae bacterium]
MNKTELITAVAEKAGTSKKDTEAVINATMDVIKSTVAGGDDKVVLVY